MSIFNPVPTVPYGVASSVTATHTAQPKASTVSLVAKAFDPRSISGLVGWWDFSDYTTVCSDKSGASPIAGTANATFQSVNDKSGNANRLSQASATVDWVYNILNGKGMAQWASGGTNILTTGTLSGWGTPSALTIFVVLDSDNAADNFKKIVTGGVAAEPWNNPQCFNLQQGAASDYAIERDVFGATPTQTSVANSGSPGLITAVFNTSTNASSINFLGNTGSDSTNLASAFNATSTVGIGGRHDVLGDGFPGRIGEVLIYNTALSTADQDKVKTYLRSRWAVS